MSMTEVLAELRKIRFKLDTISCTGGYAPFFSDHVVKRFSVDETMKELDLGGTVHVVKVTAIDSPVMINLDREISGDEYFNLIPHQQKLIARATSKIYAKVLEGYGSGTLIVEGLKIA
ncbi:MAG: hypothetical protein DRO12_02430 [Thermoprotei archaeon]|nr:MAG: hypothetical protein DRO12_02430 [Thermoprotei archaeon]